MFRKNEEAHTEWSTENVQMCADRQDEILEAAACMLLPGGRMVYSTCTFAPLENECAIARFLQANPDFTVKEIWLNELPTDLQEWGIQPGNPAWAEEEMGSLDETIKEQLKKTIRLFPHKVKGEGHFAAVLEKNGTLPDISDKMLSRNGIEKTVSLEKAENILEF